MGRASAATSAEATKTWVFLIESSFIRSSRSERARWARGARPSGPLGRLDSGNPGIGSRASRGSARTRSAPSRVKGDMSGPPRPWHRISVKLAGVLALVTFLAVGAVGLATYQRHQVEVQDTVGTQL